MSVSLGNYRWPDPPDEQKWADCVHCGFCLEVCPTYQETGYEQQSPRGRVLLIKAVAEGKLEVDEAFSEPVFTCLDCRACETACPADVQVGGLIEEARGQIRQAMPLTGKQAFLHSLFLKKIFPYPKRLHGLGKLLSFYQKSGLQSLARKAKLLNILPQHLQEMEASTPPVKPSIRKTYPEVVPAEGEQKGRVALFLGCVMDVLFSDVHEATIRVLTRNGYEVVIPREQSCCGALHVHAGERDLGRALARQNMAAFKEVDHVLVNAAGCGCAMQEYPELFKRDEQLRKEAESFSEKVEDVAKFLYRNNYRKPKGRIQARITYHDACHLAHGQGVRMEPRTILKDIPGVELVELPNADRCCGSAGIYNLTHPELANRLLERKMDDIPEKVDVISMGNPGCMLQIAVGVMRQGGEEKIMHTIQILDWAYQQEEMLREG